MAAEKDLADRAVSIFGRVSTGRTSVRDALDEACSSGKTCEVALVAAVARGSLARGPEGPAELGRVLVQAGAGVLGVQVRARAAQADHRGAGRHEVGVAPAVAGARPRRDHVVVHRVRAAPVAAADRDDAAAFRARLVNPRRRLFADEQLLFRRRILTVEVVMR